MADPDGIQVELTEERWRHIVDGHPELADFRLEILMAIGVPDRILRGRAANERWNHLGGVGPSRFSQGGHRLP